MRNFQSPGRSMLYAQNGMCAASHPLAAQVAVGILQDGGNAVDASIAAALLLGLCEPAMTGLGGDCFVLLQPGRGAELVGLNGSGRAPAGFDAERLRAAGHVTVPGDTPDAVTLPGAVDAFVRLSADWGKLGLEASLAPVIRYAEEGVPVAPRVALDWAQNEAHLKGDARVHYLDGGKAPTEGQVFRAPLQAEVLRRIARDGRAGFYEGEVAEDMVASLNALGGVHAMADFAGVSCDYVTPVVGSYRGHELVELPPNGQGATAILIAGILEQFDLAGLNPHGAARAHLEAEAVKLAYDARDRFIADPDANGVRLDHMLSKVTAERLAALIDLEQALPDVPRAAEAVHRETVYLTVVDRNRMAVSMIYSIFNSFGSGLASRKFGINFHNRGACFSLERGHANEGAGGKRPMHTIIPGMLRLDGRFTMPFGVMGGAYQPAGHARFISNMIDFGMDMQTAIDAPRSFPDAGGLELETGYGVEVAESLRKLGHEVAWRDMPMGGAQAIRIGHESGVLAGASDPRKDGCALGY